MKKIPVSGKNQRNQYWRLAEPGIEFVSRRNERIKCKMKQRYQLKEICHKEMEKRNCSMWIANIK